MRVFFIIIKITKYIYKKIMNKSTIEDLCRMGLITKTGLIGSKLVEDLQARELFTKSFITMTGLISNVDAPEPVLEEVDPEDTEAVAQAQAKYEAAVAARNAAIESRLINYVEQKKTWASESGECDWLMMDASSPAYIKNRTHYKFVDTPTKTTIVVGDSQSGIALGNQMSFVNVMYSSGIQEEVNIIPEELQNEMEPIYVHVNGESLIVCEFVLKPGENGAPMLDSYQAAPISIFTGYAYLGSADAAGFFGKDGNMNNIVYVKKNGINSSEELENYIAQELGYEDVLDMRKSWMTELTGGNPGAEPDPEALAAFDNTRIARYKEIQDSFLFPTIFGGRLCIESPVIDYYEQYIQAVENNDVPSQTSYKKSPAYLDMYLVNPSEAYLNKFGFGHIESGEIPEICLDEKEYTGQDMIDGEVCCSVPLYPEASNWSKENPEPEDLEDIVCDSTLGDFGEKNLGTFESIVDRSETKQLDMKFMPEDVQITCKFWQDYMKSSNMSEPQLG